VKRSWEQWLWSLPRWLQFSLAVALPGAAALQRSFIPDEYKSSPLAFSTIAVAIAAYVGGLWPGVVAAISSLIFGIASINAKSGDFLDPSLRFQILTGAFIWSFLSVMCDRLRNTAMRSRHMATELSTERERLGTILDSLTDSYFAVNRSWKIIRTNRHFDALMDEHGRLIGRDLWTVLRGYENTPVYEALHRALEDQITTRADVSQLAEGKWFNFRAYPNVEGLFVVVQDITEEKDWEIRRERLLADERMARSQAEQASRLKDDFLATLSHELRTPLTAVLGWLELLQARKIEDAAVSEGISAVDKAARRLTQLIDELLDLSRINAGKVKLSLEFLDLADSVAEAVASAQPTAAAKEIDLSFEGGSEVAIVRADVARIHQVLNNLISNAIKFTPSGGRVRVALTADESDYVVSVTDSGQGIDPVFLPYIFDRFRQANASITRRHGGLGLGLSIVRQLVELHGGSVEAESDGEGLGSRFTIRIPMTIVEIPSEPPTLLDADAPVEIDLRQVRVLLVEDDEGTRQILSRLLHDGGAQVTAAISAQEALDKIVEARPTLILSDIGMPDMDGYQLIQKIRERTDAWGRTPAIALTAFARPEDRQQALAGGFDAHLTKPVNSSELLAEVRRVAAKTISPFK
jgi:signal transduction histidine kinase/ActR/RegA family two-component response regulator